eukprot:g19429.t1
MRDPDQRGVLLLKPADVLDLSVLLSKIHVEGAPVVPVSNFSIKHLSDQVIGQELVTVAQASAGSGGEILRNVAKSSSSAASSGGRKAAFRVVEDEVPEVSVDSFAKCVNALRSKTNVEGRNPKARKVLEVANDPEARRAAVSKLDELADTSKADAQKDSLAQRYLDVAESLCGVVGCYSSLCEFLAVSLDSYKTTASAVRQVMKSSLCVMDDGEKDALEAVLRRPSEVQKLAVDYRGKNDSGIAVGWDQGDLVVNFKEASLKVNKYKSIRVRCMCKQLGHPDFQDFQKCVKVIKSRELWTQGKKWRLDPKKPGLMPVHLFATMQTQCQGAAVNALLTMPQRDDCIAKFWSAQNCLSPEDAVVTWGECLMDTQALSSDVPGTTYEGRVRRWVEDDLPALWRSNYRAQERIRNEKLELRKEAEENRAKDAAQAAANLAAATAAQAQWGRKGGRGGKGQRDGPFGKGKGGKKKQVCHPFLAGNCTYGNNCKFLHPRNEAQFSKQEFEVVRTEFPEKMRGIKCGQWHSSAGEKDLEEKKD